MENIALKCHERTDHHGMYVMVEAIGFGIGPGYGWAIIGKNVNCEPEPTRTQQDTHQQAPHAVGLYSNKKKQVGIKMCGLYTTLLVHFGFDMSPVLYIRCSIQDVLVNIVALMLLRGV